VLTLWTTFIHQPDPKADFEAYARYVSTTSYLVEHLFGSILGVMLAIFGAVALSIYLSSRRSALVGMVTSVAGHILILTILGMSTFATPAVGRAYLEGQRNIVEVNQDILGAPVIGTALLGGLLYSTGTILFGVAMWRSAMLPRWGRSPLRPHGVANLHLGLGDRASSNGRIPTDNHRWKMDCLECCAPTPNGCSRTTSTAFPRQLGT
jgi:hypothetical protein